MTVDILADRDSHQRVAIAAMAERDYAEKMYRDTVAELDRCIADLREAEAYIAALRGPLLYHFGTTDPELLQEVWIDNHRGLCGKTATSPEVPNLPHTDHLPGCHWQRTLPTECEWRDTHHYCPHPNHACTCAELALIDVYEHGPAAASPPPSPNARCDWHFEVDALTEERCAFAKGHDGRHSYERAAASPVPVGTPSGLSIGGFDLSPVGTPAPTLTTSLVAAVSLLVEKYGRGQKSGRADYSVVIPCDDFDTLRTALTETPMPDLSDLKPEACAELAEFEAHLRAHYAVAQLDCRFCLLRLSRRSKQCCAECGFEMHKVIDRKGGFTCSSLRCERYGVRTRAIAASLHTDTP